MTTPDFGFVHQSDRLNDYVVPLCNIEQAADGVRMTRFLGTAFFIGNRGCALTAAHVLKEAEALAIMVSAPDRSFRVFVATEYDIHPGEDLAVIRIAPLPGGTPWKSCVSRPWVNPNSALPYFLLGFPESAIWELEKDGRAIARPDLIYSEGHVRRRMTDVPLLGIKGSQFLELSQIAGPGCSGSPVIFKNTSPGRQPWQLVGVYIGDRTVYIGDRTDNYTTSVGYATRINDVLDWAPETLGRTLGEELVDT